VIAFRLISSHESKWGATYTEEALLRFVKNPTSLHTAVRESFVEKLEFINQVPHEFAVLRENEQFYLIVKFLSDVDAVAFQLTFV
jgi:hypothetical protein